MACRCFFQEVQQALLDSEIEANNTVHIKKDIEILGGGPFR